VTSAKGPPDPRWVTRVLAETYGSPRHGNKDDPLDELVFILLSQMTTQKSFGRVFERLKEQLPTWDQVLEVPTPYLQSLIQDAGLSGQRASRIHSILETLREDFGAPTLEPLREESDEEAEAYLTSLPGVGVKTAKCVMMYSLGRAVLPVDTHVLRVATRLGLVYPDTTRSQAHRLLAAVIPAKDRYAFHVNALAHGRAVCKARKPECPSCPLQLLCPYGKGVDPS
jgi:endonuclease III